MIQQYYFCSSSSGSASRVTFASSSWDSVVSVSFSWEGLFLGGDTIVHPWFFRPCCFIGLQDCHFGATIFNKHRRLSLVDGAFWRTWVTSIPEKWLNELLQFMDLCFLWCSKKYNIIYYWLWQKTCLFYVFPLLSQDLFAPPPRTWSRLRNKKNRLYFKAGELGLHLGSEIHCGERIDGAGATPLPKIWLNRKGLW